MMRNNDDAVSPVIGVILMVAITVILAAVIAMFAFDMAGNMQSGKIVGVTAKLSGDDIIVTYMGGPDHATLEKLNVIVQGEGEEWEKPGVGEKRIVSVTDKEPPFTVTVVGKFSDGTEVLLLDKTL
jgi:flagellin-like protein